MGLGRGVQVRQRRAPLYDHAPRASVDGRGLHPREVDHDTIVAQGVSGNVVSAPSDGEHNPAVPRKVHRMHDIRCGPAPDDHPGPLVDRRVPDLARVLIAVVARKKDLSNNPALQLLYLSGCQLLHGPSLVACTITFHSSIFTSTTIWRLL